MIANNHGHLVSIASSAGLIGVNGLAGVCFLLLTIACMHFCLFCPNPSEASCVFVTPTSVSVDTQAVGAANIFHAIQRNMLYVHHFPVAVLFLDLPSYVPILCLAYKTLIGWLFLQLGEASRGTTPDLFDFWRNQWCGPLFRCLEPTDSVCADFSSFIPFTIVLDFLNTSALELEMMRSSACK